jgi:hypothetical protein
LPLFSLALIAPLLPLDTPCHYAIDADTPLIAIIAIIDAIFH